ncbi:MAG TPA: PadR family transcriptional regulator [Candidatus Dormibacteraeota bacterium]|jgi:DNA-binding PadR family transcriptional regulator
MNEPRRDITNPLALAVLALLFERPMHPYEIASLMRERAIHEAIKLNYGSLYTVVDLLLRHGLIEAQSTARDGRRPERTVYRLTDAGRARFRGWLRELLRTPAKEYTQFAAGLAFAAAVGIDELGSLLEERAGRIEAELAEARGIFADLTARGLPRLFTLEGEHAMVLRTAELEWVRGVIAAIAGGRLALPTAEEMAVLHQNFPTAAPMPAQSDGSAPSPREETPL